jgi:hypothetical protein
MKGNEVDAWFASYENPHKALMQKIRSFILAADKRMGECIKWKTPTFTYEGNLASFNPRSKAHVSLMFHTGAKIPGSYKLLEGTGGTARFISFKDGKDFAAAKPELKRIVKVWCDSKSE